MKNLVRVNVTVLSLQNKRLVSRNENPIATAHIKTMSKKRNANINWVVGHHAVLAVLKTNPERAIELHVVMNPRNNAQAEILDRVGSMGLPIHSLDKRALSKLCDSEQHQGVVFLPEKKLKGVKKNLIV